MATREREGGHVTSTHANSRAGGSKAVADSFRLLVIDDDPGVREYLQALMSRRGYSVFTAEGGEEALSGLGTTRPDLITIDLVLDGMDGIENMRQSKERVHGGPVVIRAG